jgi:MFS family permease
VVPFQSEITSSGNTPDLGFTNADDTTDSAATVALIIGLVFLGVGYALDRRGYAGAATPFVAVGAIEALAGAIVLGGNDSLLLGGLLAIVAGAAVGLVGGHGDRRRATTWIGVLAVFGGCVAVISDIAPSSAAGVGGIAFGFALVLGSLAWWLAPVLGEPDDGDDRPPPTAPPGGSTEGVGFPDTAAA